MYLKILTGRYAGEIQEFPFPVAQDLIANGRAVRVNYETKAVDIIQPPAAVPAAPAAHGKKQKTRSRKSLTN
jgi:hypothetical protein